MLESVGILHLFGYDHETTEQEALKMEKKSEELIKLIEKTVPKVY